MLSKLNYCLLIFLVFILPFNNLILEVLINNFRINPSFTIYKEFITLVITIICSYFLIKNRQSEYPKNSLLLAIGAILLFSLYAIYQTLSNNINIQLLVLGFRTEVFYFICGPIITLYCSYLSRCKQLEAQKLFKNLKISIITSFCLLAIFSFFVLITNNQIYKTIGFAKDQTSVQAQVQEMASYDSINRLQSYNPTPICHSIESSVSGCRLASGFATPINFSGYLLLIFFVLLYLLSNQKNFYYQFWYLLLILVNIFLMYKTYSRFVLVGIFVAILWYTMVYLKHLKPKVQIINKLLVATSIIVLIGLPVVINQQLLLLATNSSVLKSLPPQITKSASTDGHYKLNTISYLVFNSKLPEIVYKGYGLSQTGSIAKNQYQKINETRFVKENIDIFNQVGQPREIASVPENWYMSVILNTSLIGFGMFLLSLGLYIYTNLNKQTLFLVAGIVSIAVANYFLHLWENPVVIFYTFVLGCLTALHYSNSYT
jgi:hypothetical protein